MELGVVEAPLIVAHYVGLIVARKRIRAIKSTTFAVIIRLSGSLKLLHRTRLCQHAKPHALLLTQLRALVLRHGVEDIAGSLINTQARRAATGSSGVARSDEATLGVVGLHNHAGQGIIHAPVFNRWNVNLADLELFARPDHQLFLVLP